MRLLRRFAATAALVLVLAGCGDDDGRSGSVAPQAWAAQVCAALKPWRTEISALTSTAQQRMADAKTPTEAKESLVALLAGAQAASETARVAVTGAGAPDVERGRQIAAEFAASLTRSRDAYAHARTTIEGLSTADATAFYDAVAAAFVTLNAEYAASGASPDKVGSPALQEAFSREPACG